MKILMLNYEFPPIGGGAGQAHLAILRQFTGLKELSIDVLTSAPKPGFSKQNFSDNVVIYKVGVHKKNLHFWRKIEVVEWMAKARRHYKRLIKENDYDLVHAFFGLPTGWLCYKTADRLPYIISLRGSDVPGGHSRLQMEYKLLGPLLKRIWTKASALVANSKGLRKRAISFLPSVNIEIITNGVDLNQFQSAPNREIGSQMNLLTVGRLSGTKRFDMLIDAVKILHDKGKPVHLTIAGGGGLFEELKGLIERKNLDGIVNLAGRIETEIMPDIYRQHDIFVTATMQEGMSNAMLEAMATGLPIITTRCEGVEELITNNGIVVEDSSAEAIAGAIDKLYDNKQDYKAMSIAARQRAEKFGWDRVAQQYQQIYKQVCEQRNK
jgi:glycosyltransferase involved in cell wall biosynthesis